MDLAPTPSAIRAAARRVLAAERVVAPSFFARSVHEVALDLLGKVLVREVDGAVRAGAITEVEAYEGTGDLASHARSGRATARTWPMFAEPGRLYVYLVYGMHHCLNLRAGDSDAPGALLIRRCEPLLGLEAMAQARGRRRAGLMDGPGKVAQALGLDLSHSGAWLGDAVEIWALAEPPLGPIGRGRRIGLNRQRCGAATDFLWRYFL